MVSLRLEKASSSLSVKKDCWMARRLDCLLDANNQTIRQSNHQTILTFLKTINSKYNEYTEL